MTILHGDCRDVMATMDAASVDAIVTDPPYGLSFMGKGWDKGVPGVEFWEAMLRVLKPGGYLLAFGGTRTFHRMTVAIEDAGFEIRDCLSWLYGSGFPKSLDVSKAIDKAAGVEREVVGFDLQKAKQQTGQSNTAALNNRIANDGRITAPATDAAKQWEGWGTALKPGYEPVIVARKPQDDQRERDIIAENLLRLEAQLWSLLPASFAIDHLQSSRAEYDAACGFAAWSAEDQRNTLAGLCDQTDTQWCWWMANTCLNTVMSWNSTLAENWRHTSTSTTEERALNTGQIIDWRILKSCLSGLTPRTIIQAAMQDDGSTLSALPAARLFSAASLSMRATHELSALGSAIDLGRTKLPVEAALVPNWEPIILARKPLAGTVAATVLEHGTGALNIDGCRIATSTDDPNRRDNPSIDRQAWRADGPSSGYGYQQVMRKPTLQQGRWPANVVLDEVAAEMLDAQSGERKSNSGRPFRRNVGGFARELEVRSDCPDVIPQSTGFYGDTGGASRFFYCAKSPRSERGDDNHHPTVKPISLMRWLCRLITLPEGLILDPFAGSGSTGCAAVQEGFRFIGIEQDEAYVEIARRRIEHWRGKSQQLELAS